MKIIQISDTHLFANTSQILWETNPYNNLCRVIEAVKKESKPDLLLLTGDLSQDDTPQSYQILASLIDALNIPCYFVPGNHDDVVVLNQEFVGTNINKNKFLSFANWVLILLDSTVPGKIPGFLSEQELSFLQECLQKSKNKSVAIALHHHPISINSRLMDQYILENGAEFENIILQFPQIKLVLFGHVHQVFRYDKQHLVYLSCPSTFVQFAPGASTLEFDKQPPGYRVLTLSEKGFSTEIKRVW